MPPLFRRHSNIRCFFCQSHVPFPSNIRNFKCTACSCWNRYDESGEIISDEPAMHEEHLNSRSFAKRGSPSKDRLPTMYGPGPFCHSCQTNQMLLINLLSNYLPDVSSPEYQSRVEMLPAYRDSLHTRYPPVCESCLPQVEEEMRQKEQMARAKALGGWLSKGKERRQRRERISSKEVYWWRVRGCLFAASYAISIASSLAAVYGYYPFGWSSFLHPILPAIVAISLLWTVWDPTYLSFRKAEIQGRDVRIHGKRTYNMVQILTWSTRIFSSIILCVRWFRPDLNILQLDGPRTIYLLTIFSVEIITIAVSCFVLRIQQPPAIRLVDTHSHKFDKYPIDYSKTSTSIILRARCATVIIFSSKPVISRVNHVFGLPSMQAAPMQTPQKPEINEDEMDWTPTNPENGSSFTKKTTALEDDSWLRPQRFFAPEKPTGLEGLFESTRIQDEPMPYQQPDGAGTKTSGLSKHLWKWGPLYTLFIALVAASVTYTLKWAGLMQWAF
ncbi:Ima1 N-terminal domain-containing protein [Pholiota molesta]|nr:Ima1 N-terminal domain-containing protein [Pholiota molesta]